MARVTGERGRRKLPTFDLNELPETESPAATRADATVGEIVDNDGNSTTPKFSHIRGSATTTSNTSVLKRENKVVLGEVESVLHSGQPSRSPNAKLRRLRRKRAGESTDVHNRVPPSEGKKSCTKLVSEEGKPSRLISGLPSSELGKTFGVEYWRANLGEGQPSPIIIEKALDDPSFPFSGEQRPVSCEVVLKDCNKDTRGWLVSKQNATFLSEDYGVKIDQFEAIVAETSTTSLQTRQGCPDFRVTLAVMEQPKGLSEEEAKWFLHQAAEMVRAVASRGVLTKNFWYDGHTAQLGTGDKGPSIQEFKKNLEIIEEKNRVIITTDVELDKNTEIESKKWFPAVCLKLKGIRQKGFLEAAKQVEELLSGMAILFSKDCHGGTRKAGSKDAELLKIDLNRSKCKSRSSRLQNPLQVDTFESILPVSSFRPTPQPPLHPGSTNRKQEESPSEVPRARVVSNDSETVPEALNKNPMQVIDIFDTLSPVSPIATTSQPPLDPGSADRKQDELPSEVPLASVVSNGSESIPEAYNKTPMQVIDIFDTLSPVSPIATTSQPPVDPSSADRKQDEPPSEVPLASVVSNGSESVLEASSKIPLHVNISKPLLPVSKTTSQDSQRPLDPNPTNCKQEASASEVSRSASVVYSGSESVLERLSKGPPPSGCPRPEVASLTVGHQRMALLLTNLKGNPSVHYLRNVFHGIIQKHIIPAQRNVRDRNPSVDLFIDCNPGQSSALVHLEPPALVQKVLDLHFRKPEVFYGMKMELRVLPVGQDKSGGPAMQVNSTGQYRKEGVQRSRKPHSLPDRTIYVSRLPSNASGGAIRGVFESVLSTHMSAEQKSTIGLHTVVEVRHNPPQTYAFVELGSNELSHLVLHLYNQHKEIFPNMHLAPHQFRTRE